MSAVAWKKSGDITITRDMTKVETAYTWEISGQNLSYAYTDEKYSDCTLSFYRTGSDTYAQSMIVGFVADISDISYGRNKLNVYGFYLEPFSYDSGRRGRFYTLTNSEYDNTFDYIVHAKFENDISGPQKYTNNTDSVFKVSCDTSSNTVSLLLNDSPVHTIYVPNIPQLIPVIYFIGDNNNSRLMLQLQQKYAIDDSKLSITGASDTSGNNKILLIVAFFAFLLFFLFKRR
jgi:hypothetical protein